MAVFGDKRTGTVSFSSELGISETGKNTLGFNPDHLKGLRWQQIVRKVENTGKWVCPDGELEPIEKNTETGLWEVVDSQGVINFGSC